MVPFAEQNGAFKPIYCHRTTAWTQEQLPCRVFILEWTLVLRTLLHVMHRALELPGDIDLSNLSYFLYAQGIPHKVTEESGKQVVWTENEEKSRIVTSLYQQWQSGDLKLQTAPPRRGMNAGGFLKSIPWQRMPVTFLFMLACIVVALITRAGANWHATAWFSFIPFEVANGYLYFGSLGMGLDRGQYWRLISPIFLHFGLTHLAFNMLALYIFWQSTGGSSGRCPSTGHHCVYCCDFQFRPVFLGWG